MAVTRIVCLLFIFVGVFLRLDAWMQNRSLRGDEAAYFICNASRTPTAILLNRNVNFYSPAAPIGYTWIEKLIVHALGYQEYILRLLPCILSILSLLLFYFVLGYFLEDEIVLALGLFALSGPLIFYGTDLRPYTCDVFFALLTLWLFLRMEQRQLSAIDKLSFVLVSIAGVWFSYPLVFCLAGLALVRPSRTHIGWIISFLAVYFYSIYPVIQAGITAHMWQGHFITNIFKDPLQVSISLIGFLVFILGCWHLFQNNRKSLVVLISPMALSFLAAVMHIYPFGGRTSLFLLPFFLILMASGVRFLWSYGKLGKAEVVIVLFLFFLNPVKQIAYAQAHGWANEQGREAIIYLKEHWQPGDALVMNQTAKFVFGYYMGYFHMDMKNQWIDCIWDGLFDDKRGFHARTLREKLSSNAQGFAVNILKNKNTQPQRIYPDQWLNVDAQRQWLLLINPSDKLRRLLQMSLSHAHGHLQVIAFPHAYLYLLVQH